VNICHCKAGLAFKKKKTITLLLKIVCISQEKIPQTYVKMQVSFVNEAPEN
jgi:hypothetical protein